MKTSLLALTICFGSLLSAQETYWVANRTSVDLNEINTAGKVIRTISLSPTVTGLRSAHVAPDGKVWVVAFITSTFLIVDPTTATVTPITSASGNPYDIAFDAAGHGWISGGASVVEYDANGAVLASYPMLAGSPLGISIDGAGNKWIAHRTTAPGSISRIDPSGVVTNYPLASGNMSPTRCYADYRGILAPSHIWVIGDNAPQLAEFDDSGTFLNLYTYSGSIGSIAQDASGDLWLGDFGATANLFRIDPATGAVRSNFNSPPSVLGVAVDGFNRIWTTARISAPPCEVRRIDETSGTMEVAAPVGTGTQSALSTRMQYAMVVDPFGDLDGDGVANLFEATGGSSPFDGCSTNITSLRTTGVTHISNTATIELTAVAGSASVLEFGTRALPTGAGIRIPGIGCALQLDPAWMGGLLAVVGSGSIPVAIPNNPVLVGLDVYAQALTFGATMQFSNLTALRIW